MHKILGIFVLSLLLSPLLQAKMVDGLALIVEGEAVTTAEISALKDQLNITKEKAIDLLIQDRLQKAAMKEISITEDEVDDKVLGIAKQNKLTIPKMQKILKSEGTTWIQYRESIKDGLKKEKFYQEKVISSIADPSEDELKLYYNEHQSEFNIPSKIYLTEYSAKKDKTLKKFLKTKKKKNIKAKKIIKTTKKLDPELLSMFLQIPINGFSAIINAGDKYIVYKKTAQKGSITMPFGMALSAVNAKWKQGQQVRALKDYFEKMRTRADIQILR